MKKVGKIVLGSMRKYTRANMIMGLMTYNVTMSTGRKSTETLRWQIGVILGLEEALDFINETSEWASKLDMKSCKTGDDFINAIDHKISIEVNSLPGIHQYNHDFSKPTYYIEETELL
jgi:hypothetical protein